MKRIGYVFDDFVSFSNLWLAWRKAYKGSHMAYSTKEFYFNAEKEVLRLQEQLISGIYHPEGFHTFQIYDPKERTISVAPFRDRVVHHAIVNILEPVYERCFDDHSYATRKGKGTHKAILQAQKYLRSHRWFLKMDVSKYFDSIDHQILKNTLQRKFKDDRFLDVVFRIIDSGGHENRGLPIGNLTSQFLANVYLDTLDTFVRQKLPACAYNRYMDDFILFSNSKESLKQIKPLIESFLAEQLNLSLKEKVTFINQRLNGLSFLGARIYPATIRIHPKSLKRSMKTLQKRTWEKKRGLISNEHYQNTLGAIIAHLSWFNTYALRRNLFISG